jgi:hypothetical protein
MRKTTLLKTDPMIYLGTPAPIAVSLPRGRLAATPHESLFMPNGARRARLSALLQHVVARVETVLIEKLEPSEATTKGASNR